MGRSIFILHSALTPNAVGDVLRREVDEERRTLGSPSGFRGDHAILGDVGQDSFRLRKRRNSRNDFAGQFYARFEPESGGTKIEGFFDSPRWTKYFMIIWLAAAAVIGIPIFALTLTDAITGTHHIDGNLWVDSLFHPAFCSSVSYCPELVVFLVKETNDSSWSSCRTRLQHVWKIPHHRALPRKYDCCVFRGHPDARLNDSFSQVDQE
jgi:hypothetical protein